MTRHVKHFCSIATAFFARSLESVFARSRLLDRDCSKVFLLEGVFARKRLLESDCSKVFLLEGVFARKRLLESYCSKAIARKYFCSKAFLLDRDCSKALLLRSRLLESVFARSKAIARKRLLDRDCFLCSIEGDCSKAIRFCSRSDCSKGIYSYRSGGNCDIDEW